MSKLGYIVKYMALILIKFIFSMPIHKLFWLIAYLISLVITVFFPYLPYLKIVFNSFTGDDFIKLPPLPNSSL